MQTLKQIAQDALLTDRNATYSKVTHYQRNQMREAVIRELGTQADETVESVLKTREFAEKLIEILQEENFADRNVLCKELGLMLANSAEQYCKKTANNELDTSSSELSVQYQFPNYDSRANYLNRENNKGADLNNFIGGVY